MKNGFLPFFRLLPARHSAPLKSAPIHYCLSENTMKKTLALALLLSLPMLVQAQDDEKNSGLIKSVSGAVSGAVQSGKDIIKGVKQGWDEGRQGGTSLDDAVIIHDRKFKDYVEIRIFSVNLDAGVYTVNIGIKNKTDRIVRLTNLMEQKNLQLLDQDKYVAYSGSVDNDITVPKSAAIKYTFYFPSSALVSAAKTLRLYEEDIPLN